MVTRMLSDILILVNRSGAGTKLPSLARGRTAPRQHKLFSSHFYLQVQEGFARVSILSHLPK